MTQLIPSLNNDVWKIILSYVPVGLYGTLCSLSRGHDTYMTAKYPLKMLWKWLMMEYIIIGIELSRKGHNNSPAIHKTTMIYLWSRTFAYIQQNNSRTSELCFGYKCRFADEHISICYRHLLLRKVASHYIRSDITSMTWLKAFGAHIVAGDIFETIQMRILTTMIASFGKSEQRIEDILTIFIPSYPKLKGTIFERLFSFNIAPSVMIQLFGAIYTNLSYNTKVSFPNNTNLIPFKQRPTYMPLFHDDVERNGYFYYIPYRKEECNGFKVVLDTTIVAVMPRSDECVIC